MHQNRARQTGGEGKQRGGGEQKKKKKNLKAIPEAAGCLAGRCAGMRGDGMRRDAGGSGAHRPHTHTDTGSQTDRHTRVPGMQRLTPWQGPPLPIPAPLHPVKQGAPKHQGHPLEQHQAQRRMDGHRAALARGPSPGTVPIPPAQRSDTGHATGLAHTRVAPLRLLLKAGFSRRH